MKKKKNGKTFLRNTNVVKMTKSGTGLHGKNKQAQNAWKITDAYVGTIIIGTEVYVSIFVDPDPLGSTNYLHVRVWKWTRCLTSDVDLE